MALKASEISSLIKDRIEKFDSIAEARDVGTVIGVTDGIVRIHGLADSKYGESKLLAEKHVINFYYLVLI